MPTIDAKLNLLVTGAAGFIGSNLVLELQERFPNSRLSAIDDFRSGDFKNLGGYRGDFVAADLDVSGGLHCELDPKESAGAKSGDARAETDFCGGLDGNARSGGFGGGNFLARSLV